MGNVAAIIVAAGRGERAGVDLPKQYRSLGGVLVLRRAVSIFRNHRDVGMILPVIASGDEERCRQATAGLETLPPVVGGATRQASVRAGLEALSARAPEIVLVHDAARPFASAALVSSAIAAGRKHGAAVPALPVTDTIKTVDPRGNVAATLERAALRTIQTPQAFEFTRLLAAHRKAAAAGQENFSDDAALIEWAGSQVATFAGETGNIKLTTTEDFVRAEAELIGRLGDVRVGTGYDVHAFGEGDHIMLGGVRIAHARGLVGHSDADVVLHALVDAILGAIADGDIGVHFPPGDAAWRNASSDRFLAFAVGRVRARGGMIAHLDAAVVCEAPRIAPHRDAMRARIAEIAGVTPDRVALQATTSEKLGFAGRGEGIAAMATATVRLPLRSGDEGTS